MRETTVYGLKCPKEDERIVVDAVNASLSKMKRSTSKATSKSLLEARKPFVLSHYVWCLNKDCGVYFEIYRNEDLNGKLHYPKDSSIGLLLMLVIQENGFRGGKPLNKTKEFVERVVESVGVPCELLAEGDEREEVEAALVKNKTRRTNRSMGKRKPTKDVLPLKDEEEQHPVPTAWRPAFREIVNAFIEHDYRLTNGVEGVLPVSVKTAKQIKEYVDDYGETLVALPEKTWTSSICMWMGKRWEVLIDLWTKREGQSDLVLSALVSEAKDGFKIKIEMVYVP
jgi:hypothetical protein